MSRAADEHFCQSCGAAVEGEAYAPFDGQSTGARCSRCGSRISESADVCSACGHRAGRAPGAAALDAWLRAPVGRPLWIVEAHDATLRARLFRDARVRVVHTHPSRARVPGAVARQLAAPDSDARALADDLGRDVLLVERAHRLADSDRTLLLAMSERGARVALRAPVAQDLAGAHCANGRRPAVDWPRLEPRTRRALEALAVLGVEAPRGELRALSGMTERALAEAVDAGLVQRREDRIRFCDPDLSDAILGRLDPEDRAELSDAALELLAERDAPLAVRAEVAVGASDDSTALLLLDMHARSALAAEELTSAIEALERGIARARGASEHAATAHVGACFVRVLSELLERRGRGDEAPGWIQEALGWSGLPPADQVALEVLLAARGGRLEAPRLDGIPRGPRAQLSCERALHAAAREPALAACDTVRRGWACLEPNQALELGTQLLAERVIDRVGRTEPGAAVTLVDELLESRLTRHPSSVERLWRLRCRLDRELRDQA